MHISLELYLMVLRNELPASTLVRVAHDHLLELCDTCEVEWQAYRSTGSADERLLAASPPPAPALRELPAAPDHYSVSALPPRKRRLSRIREERREARRDLRRLLAVPRSEREGKIERARKRFRSRAFAELLLEESRGRVGDEPREAESLASLVPRVLHWMAGEARHPWAGELRAAAAARRADALRRAGDPEGAEEAFTELRRHLLSQPVHDAATLAEVCELEAALRVDQGRLDDAGRLLDRAALLHGDSGEPELRLRAVVRAAEVLRAHGRPAKALDRLREEGLGGAPPGDGRRGETSVPGTPGGGAQAADDAAATGRGEPAARALAVQVLALCDLGRGEEARGLLAAWEGRSDDGDRRAAGAAETGAAASAGSAGEPACEGTGEAAGPLETTGAGRSTPALAGLRGHVLLASGRPAEAERAFAACRDGWLRRERPAGAALAALDLACAQLAAGRAEEAVRTAATTLETLRSRGAAPSLLAPLRDLAEACRSGPVPAHLPRLLRCRLQQER